MQFILEQLAIIRDKIGKTLVVFWKSRPPALPLVTRRNAVRAAAPLSAPIGRIGCISLCSHWSKGLVDFSHSFYEIPKHLRRTEYLDKYEVKWIFLFFCLYWTIIYQKFNKLPN